MVINAIKSIVINTGHGYTAYFGDIAFIRASGDRRTDGRTSGHCRRLKFAFCGWKVSNHNRETDCHEVSSRILSPSSIVDEFLL